MALRPQLLAPIGLLAIPSIAVYLLFRGQPFIAVAFLNVLLIVGSVYYLFSAPEDENGHGHAPSA
jgi:hypothetical protein